MFSSVDCGRLILRVMGPQNKKGTTIVFTESGRWTPIEPCFRLLPLIFCLQHQINRDKKPVSKGREQSYSSETSGGLK